MVITIMHWRYFQLREELFKWWCAIFAPHFAITSPMRLPKRTQQTNKCDKRARGQYHLWGQQYYLTVYECWISHVEKSATEQPNATIFAWWSTPTSIDVLIMTCTSAQMKEWITLNQPDTGKILQMKGFNIISIIITVITICKIPVLVVHKLYFNPSQNQFNVYFHHHNHDQRWSDDSKVEGHLSKAANIW